MNELTKSQAMVPDKATIIQNPLGTAPITWFDENDKVVVSMPGVPYEMKRAMTEEIILNCKNAFSRKPSSINPFEVTGYPGRPLP